MKSTLNNDDEVRKKNDGQKKKEQQNNETLLMKTTTTITLNMFTLHSSLSRVPKEYSVLYKRDVSQNHQSRAHHFHCGH